jgi:hypothetical protein|nr:hypothetical protein [Candidatus Krumholzibacteria bacterium]
MKTAALITLSILFLLISGESVSAQDSPAGDLSGQWVLDQSRSTDLTPPTPQGGRRGGGGGGRGGMGGGGRGGMGGGRPGGGQRPQGDSDRSTEMKKHHEEMIQKISRLEIFQEGPELNLTDGLDITQLIFTDGRKHSIWTQAGEVQADARWEGPVLVLQLKAPRDKTPQVRRFQLSEDGQELTITETRRFGGQKSETEIRLVYTRKK